MAITNFGQVLSSAAANTTYLLKTEDDVVTGILSLKNGTDINKHITNSQEFIYTLSDVLGVVGEADPNAKIYSSQEIIASGDNRKIAIGKLDAQVKINLDASLQNQTDIAAILASIGQPSGIAQLDATGRIPINQLPDGLFTYLGAYDATTNTPALIDGTGTVGSVYRVAVAGTQDFGSGSITFEVEDKVVYNASLVWEKWDVVDLDPRPNVTNDAQLKREDGDFNTFTEKLEPVDDDIVLIEDSENSFTKKTVKLSNLLGGGGQGGINYLGENADAERGLGDWQNLASGTIAVNTTDPLSGDADFVLTQSSATVGGIADCLFTIDKAGLVRKQYLSFDYDLSSANSFIKEYPVYVTITDATGVTEYSSTIDNLNENKQGTFLTDFIIDPSVSTYKINFQRKASSNPIPPPPAPAISFNIDNVRVSPREVTKSIGKTSWTLQFDDSLDLTEFLNEGNIGLSVTKLAGGRYKVYYNKSRFPNDPILDFIVKGDSAIDTPHISLGLVGSDGGGDYIQFYIVNSSGQATYDVSTGRYLQVTFTQKEEDQTAYQVSTDLGNREIYTRAITDTDFTVTTTETKVNFDSVERDTIGSFDSVNDRIVVAENATYFLNYLWKMNGSASASFSQAAVKIYNSSDVLKRTITAQTPSFNSASIPRDGKIIDSVKLDRGDYVEVTLDYVGFGGSTANTITSSSLTVAKEGNDAPMLGVTAPQIAIFKDVKPSGTDAGASTAGAYITRDLTEQEGLKTFASLDSNQITLEKGKYFIEFFAPAVFATRHKAKIVFVSGDIQPAILGESAYTATNTVSSSSKGFGVFTINSTTTIELRQRIQTAKTINGLGVAASFGDDEIYSTVKIQKIY